MYARLVPVLCAGNFDHLIKLNNKIVCQYLTPGIAYSMFTAN